MAFKKGHKHSEGRPKGSKNKHNALVEETAARLGVNIFQTLCYFSEGDWKALGYDSEVQFSEKGEGDGKQIRMGYTITPELRLKATESAAKYLYSQKQAVDVTSSDGSAGITVNVVDYTKK